MSAMIIRVILACPLEGNLGIAGYPVWLALRPSASSVTDYGIV